jgi:hypothetical protein
MSPLCTTSLGILKKSLESAFLTDVGLETRLCVLQFSCLHLGGPRVQMHVGSEEL